MERESKENLIEKKVGAERQKKKAGLGAKVNERGFRGFRFRRLTNYISGGIFRDDEGNLFLSDFFNYI